MWSYSSAKLEQFFSGKTLRGEKGWQWTGRKAESRAGQGYTGRRRISYLSTVVVA
jgi:hypothetical protein